MEEKKCCFTGHRTAKLGYSESSEEINILKNKITSEILAMINEKNVRHFITGMALGVDTYAAEAVLKLKEVYPDITLTCVLPCRDQTKHWSRENKQRHSAILEKADKVVVLREFYTYDCMQNRNKYMVDNSDIVLAVFNGSPGGTAQTIDYAKNQNKEIIII